MIVGLFVGKRAVWAVKYALLGKRVAHGSNSFPLNKYIVMLRQNRTSVLRRGAFSATRAAVPVDGDGIVVDTSRRHTVIDLKKVCSRVFNCAAR